MRAQKPPSRRCLVVALSGGDRGIVERLDELGEPASIEDDVLIDLADDRVARLPDAGVDRGGDAAARPVDERHAAVARDRLEDPPRAVRLPSSTAMTSNGRPSRCASIASSAARSQRRPL